MDLVFDHVLKAINLKLEKKKRLYLLKRLNSLRKEGSIRNRLGFLSSPGRREGGQSLTAGGRVPTHLGLGHVRGGPGELVSLHLGGRAAHRTLGG